MSGTESSDISALLSIPILDPLPASAVTAVLSKSPFEPVPGLVNSRWLPPPIRPKYIFRSGALDFLGPEGKKTLVDLGIKTIFDLRSEKERRASPDPAIEGIESRWEPSTLDHVVTTDAQSQTQGPKAFSFVVMYLDMLETHKAAIRSVMTHVRNHPDRPFLFHCTAGKDRTGLLAAIILDLVGADGETINYDYTLTRIGVEPAREFLLKSMFKGKPIDLEDPMLQAYAQIPYDAMTEVNASMGEKYGGVEGYVRNHLGFSSDDIVAIRTNLTK